MKIHYYVTISEAGPDNAERAERILKPTPSLARAWKQALKAARRGVSLYPAKPQAGRRALVAQCLRNAADSRSVGCKESARQWVANARLWRRNYESELALNAAFLKSRPDIAAAWKLGAERRPQFVRSNWGIHAGDYPGAYRSAVIRCTSFPESVTPSGRNKLDSRYAVRPEFAGAERPLYVARFAGEFIAAESKLSEAWRAAHAHRAAYCEELGI